MSPARRIGVFGGAFDPPHLAHVALVRSAIEALKLDEVRVLPTGQAWHRSGTLTPRPMLPLSTTVTRVAPAATSMMPTEIITARIITGTSLAMPTAVSTE